MSEVNSGNPPTKSAQTGNIDNYNSSIDTYNKGVSMITNTPGAKSSYLYYGDWDTGTMELY